MIRDQITRILKDAVKNAGFADADSNITSTANAQFGDYTTTIAMQLGKKEQKNPFSIAEKIAQNIEIKDPIGSVKIIRPGFINFFLSKNSLQNELQTILQNEGKYGSSNKFKEKKVIVEYSSPNIAKPFTIGHLRSTIIGDAIANLLEFIGFQVFRDSHIGDWGTQFGKLIYAIKHFNEYSFEDIERSKNPLKELVNLYVIFHKRAEDKPELEEEARKIFKKLEDGDKEIRALWQKCIDLSFQEFNKIYSKLGVKFTENNGRGYGESFFEDKMKPILEELEKYEWYKDSKGAKIVKFPDDKLPPFMIIKQDGATLYSTRDLATDKFRLTNSRYGKDVQIINEVGAEQSLYFRQLYETEKMLGWVNEGQRVHVKHGLYRFKDTKMSTRKGNTIWLEEVLEESRKRAYSLSRDDSKGRSEENSKKNRFDHLLANHEAEDVAEAVGIGALKWNDLKRSSHLDVVFDWDEILNMQGNSGPYMQYTYVRCLSVLSRHPLDEILPPTLRRGQNDIPLNADELAIIHMLAKFPEVLMNAAEQYAPHYVCTYLYELGQKYNLFYQKHPILKAENNMKDFRLALTAATANVIKTGLNLLGIDVVNKM